MCHMCHIWSNPKKLLRVVTKKRLQLARVRAQRTALTNQHGGAEWLFRGAMEMVLCVIASICFQSRQNESSRCESSEGAVMIE
jgi:hypothetical protein